MSDQERNQSLEIVCSELLKDRKRDRRWRNIRFGAIFSVALVLIVAQLAYNPETAVEDFGDEPYAALIELSGVIMPDSKTASDKALRGPLDRAFEDDNAEGVIIRVSSPGGTPVQSELIRARIERLAKEHDKRVVVVGEEMVTSGSYLISAVADKIYAQPSTVVGSIGVRMAGFGATELIDKIGVERRIYTAGEHKVMLDTFRDEEPKALSHNQSILDDIHQQFIKVVKAGREERLNNSEELYEGLYWTGNQALELGLIDGLGPLAEVASQEFGTDNLRNYGPELNLLDKLGIGVHQVLSVINNAGQPSIEAKWQP